jgi:energy-coupling factor transport system ATP-binding protein
MPIDFSKVSFVYNKKTPFQYEALHEVSLHLEDHRFIALVGRTGSGKSTLIQHLNALLNPTEGVVTIDDFVNSAARKGRSKNLKALRQKVGLVFQFPEYQLFEETVEKDVAFGPKNFGHKNDEALTIAHEALTKVGLDASFYARSPFELSGGEKRKVAIAGILAMQPSFLVVDEPTAGLDPEAAREMMELFKKIQLEGTTLILVTHDMNLVSTYADTVVVMEDGKVAALTTPEELFTHDLSAYSLELPLLYKTIQDLQGKGLQLDEKAIHSVDDLAKQIAAQEVHR